MPDVTRHTLAATCRCLTDDLGHTEAECGQHLKQVDDPVVADFLAKRRDHPTGQEVIQSLAPELIAHSLHVGRWRGATWHHARAGIVWLLAAAIHRADDRTADAYVLFRKLFDRGKLMPTEADVRRALAERTEGFAASLVRVLPDARARACERPGQVETILLGGRVSLRLLCEPGDPPFLYVAISQRLRPGDLEVPPEWSVLVLAALFPDAALEDLEWVGELAPNAPLHADEFGYRYFA